MFQPKGELSAYVQALWSASVTPEASENIKRWLQGDGCSGVLFNLSGPIYLDDIQHTTNVVLLPVSKQAHTMTLPPGSKMAGIRFRPGISFGVFGARFDKPVTLTKSNSPYDLLTLAAQLSHTPGHHAQVAVLYRWLNKMIDFSEVMPTPLLQALDAMQENHSFDMVRDDLSLSQRQLERQFQKRMGITPKQYQRILRVKKTVDSLKYNPETDLVELALDHGFSDQAHMTREFKQIAKITPKQLSKAVANRVAWR